MARSTSTSMYQSSPLHARPVIAAHRLAVLRDLLRSARCVPRMAGRSCNRRSRSLSSSRTKRSMRRSPSRSAAASRGRAFPLVRCGGRSSISRPLPGACARARSWRINALFDSERLDQRLDRRASIPKFEDAMQKNPRGPFLRRRAASQNLGARESFAGGAGGRERWSTMGIAASSASSAASAAAGVRAFPIPRSPSVRTRSEPLRRRSTSS